MAVAEQALVPALTRRSPDAPVLTDGFSCHTQVGHVSAAQVAPRHLAELLWESIQLSRAEPTTPGAAGQTPRP